MGAAAQPHPRQCPLLVEGTIYHPGDAETLEYSVLMEIHDEAGKLISRHALGIGALRRQEKRTFSLRVEVSSGAASP